MKSFFGLPVIRLLVVVFAWGVVVPSSAQAEKINGVPYNCVNAVRAGLIRNFARENKGEKEAIEEYREFIRSEPTYACRARKNRNIEDFAWCDGSGCTGARAKKSLRKCSVSDVWSGQDDGDIIDEAEYKSECLIKKDF